MWLLVHENPIVKDYFWAMPRDHISIWTILLEYHYMPQEQEEMFILLLTAAESFCVSRKMIIYIFMETSSLEY